jgi:hypothetical protein
MRKKGGQRLLEMSRRKTPPVIEEVLPVRRYTDSDRFEKPILHDVGPIEEELPPAPPAPARQDLIGKMFPRLRAAMNLFGQIDVSRFRQARGEAGRKTFDKAVGETLLDSVLVNQLADLENRLSLDITPKNLPQIQSRLNERRLGGVLTPIDEKSASQAILKRLQTNRTKSDDPGVRKGEKLAELAEIEAKDRETVAELLQIQIPIMAFNDAELESLFPKVGLEVPSGDDITIMEQLVAAYEKSSGFKRTVFQAWVVIHHPEMDQEFFDWMPAGPEEE